MISSRQGIVLDFIKYGENSVIITIYTRETGRQSYIMTISRSRKSSAKTGIIQPLFMVEIIVYVKEGREIQRIREIKNQPVYQNIPFDVIKSSQVMFLAEIMYKTLREQESAPDLYDFITNALLFFDLADEETPNFHLWFLLRLADFLGIKPDFNIEGERCWFDLQKGGIVYNEPTHPFFMPTEASISLSKLAHLKIDEIGSMKISRSLRNYLTAGIIDYYQLHFEHLGEIKSLKILNEIFL